MASLGDAIEAIIQHLTIARGNRCTLYANRRFQLDSNLACNFINMCSSTNSNVLCNLETKCYVHGTVGPVLQMETFCDYLLKV